MPLKKKLPTGQAPPPEKKQARAKQTAKPPRAAPPAPAKTALGPPVDPATLPGANESAPSLAGQTYDFRYSVTDNVLTWHFDRAVNHDTKANWVWRQCGAAVVLEHRSARYIGRFEGEALKGTGFNDTGASWEWSGTPAPKGTKKPAGVCYHAPFGE